MTHSHRIGWIALLLCACCANVHGVDDMGRRALEPRSARITLRAEVLDRYVGVYVVGRHSSAATYLTVRRRGPQLSLEISDIPGALTLSARRQNVFTAPYGIELTFVGSGAGPAAQLRYRLHDLEHIAERAELGLEF